MALMVAYLGRLESEKVAVHVGAGPNSRTFNVPGDLLRTVAWFDNALKADTFLEGTERSISLPEDVPATFEHFLYWLHTKQLFFEKTPTDLDEKVRVGSAELIDCFRLWVFGDKYILASLQNAAMLRMSVLFKRDMVSFEVLGDCFHIANHHITLQSMIADYVVLCMQREGPEFAFRNIPTQLSESASFLVALSESSIASQQLSKGDFPRWLKPRKNSSLLYKSYLQSASDRVSYDGTWMTTVRVCEDCGLRRRPTVVKCKGCANHKKCSCTGEPEWVCICRSCNENHENGSGR